MPQYQRRRRAEKSGLNGKLEIDFVLRNNLKSQTLVKGEGAAIGDGNGAAEADAGGAGGSDGFGDECGSNAAALELREQRDIDEQVLGGGMEEPDAADGRAVEENDAVAAGELGRIAVLLALVLDGQESVELGGRQWDVGEFGSANRFEKGEEEGIVFWRGGACGDGGRHGRK